jgi:hypothetical protein
MVSGLTGTTYEEKCAELGLETLKNQTRPTGYGISTQVRDE